MKWEIQSAIPMHCSLTQFYSNSYDEKEFEIKGKYRKSFWYVCFKRYIYIYNFFPLNCWMDRSDDHKPVRITEEQTTLCSSLDLKQVCN